MNDDMYSEDYSGNYADRCVARDDFETAVMHNEYSTSISPNHFDSMLIVENYQTQELAASGHKRWIRTMTQEKLPKELLECHNAGIAMLTKIVGGDLNQIHRKQEKDHGRQH